LIEARPARYTQTGLGGIVFHIENCASAGISNDRLPATREKREKNLVTFVSNEVLF
jgi:hypothetical protein